MYLCRSVSSLTGAAWLALIWKHHNLTQLSESGFIKVLISWGLTGVHSPPLLSSVSSFTMKSSQKVIQEQSPEYLETSSLLQGKSVFFSHIYGDQPSITTGTVGSYPVQMKLSMAALLFTNIGGRKLFPFWSFWL